MKNRLSSLFSSILCALLSQKMMISFKCMTVCDFDLSIKIVSYFYFKKTKIFT